MGGSLTAARISAPRYVTDAQRRDRGVWRRADGRVVSQARRSVGALALTVVAGTETATGRLERGVRAGIRQAEDL